MMRKTLILLLIISGLSSCITQNRRARICATCPVTTQVVTVVKDSIWVKEIVKHDTIYQPVEGPTVVIPGPCDKLCDENGKLKAFYKETRKNGIDETIKTNVAKNELIIDCKDDSLMKVIETHEKTITHLIKENDTITKTKPPVEINVLTWWQKFMIKSGYLFWLILIIFGGIKGYKIYTHLPKI